VAWRRGDRSITDCATIPAIDIEVRTPAWWEHVVWGMVAVVFVLPVLIVVLIVVTPPVFAVSLLARLSRKTF
jgi:hypothetical protein